jgi:acyl carrier protein
LTEKALTDIRAEVLQIKEIGRHDSFFDIGGDSPMAMMIISRINQQFGITLTIAKVMNNDTIAQLGEIIDSVPGIPAETLPGVRQSGNDEVGQ